MLPLLSVVLWYLVSRVALRLFVLRLSGGGEKFVRALSHILNQVRVKKPTTTHEERLAFLRRMWFVLWAVPPVFELVLCLWLLGLVYYAARVLPGRYALWARVRYLRKRAALSARRHPRGG